MRAPARLSLVLASVLFMLIGGAGPAGAVVQKPQAVAPTCQIAGVQNLTGSTFVGNQTVNGIFSYATGVLCNQTVTDIALYEELDFNSTKVDSLFKNFTGTPRDRDAILHQTPCQVCTGTWKFIYGQVIQAPAGFLFTSPPMGCVTVQNGKYLFCVEVNTLTIP